MTAAEDVASAEQWASDPVSAAAAEDNEHVERVMAEMKATYEQWEELLEAQGAITFEADFGDIYALVNQDGRLLQLSFAADVMSSYTFIELQARVNALIGVLADAVYEEHHNTFGGILE